jgi:hypothetical protein
MHCHPGIGLTRTNPGFSSGKHASAPNRNTSGGKGRITSPSPGPDSQT